MVEQMSLDYLIFPSSELPAKTIGYTWLSQLTKIIKILYVFQALILKFYLSFMGYPV